MCCTDQPCFNSPFTFKHNHCLFYINSRPTLHVNVKAEKMDVDYSIRPKGVIMFTVEPLITTQTWFYNVSGSERSYLCEPAFRLHYWLENEALRSTRGRDISCGLVTPPLLYKFATLLKKMIVLCHSEWTNNTVYC